MLKIARKPITILIIVFAISISLFAIKNVLYQINQHACRECGRCTLYCPTQAIQFNEHSGGLYINSELCDGCGNCVLHCPYGAIYSYTPNSDDTLPMPELKLNINPNPVNDFTDFMIKLPAKSRNAVLRITNVKGQHVFTYKITNNDITYRWNCKDDTGKVLPEGIYFASLFCGTARTTNKITLVR